jgi:GPI ethanolamine phosphate transferase 3 subunit O
MLGIVLNLPKAIRIYYWDRIPWHANMPSKGLCLLIWVFFVHLAGIYLFTSGFLLTRLSLSAFNDCSACTMPPTYKRAVFLVIDALRFDFISPNPPYPPSPYHHKILTLPAELTAANPDKSFIFNAYADPPTTTLQRIKGITTGSLPTFIDMGSNFAGSSIIEDSIITQMEHAGKRVSTAPISVIRAKLFLRNDQER